MQFLIEEDTRQMTDVDADSLIRMAAFEHVRKLGEIHDHLTANELKPGNCGG